MSMHYSPLYANEYHRSAQYGEAKIRPQGDVSKPLRALLVDSWYDNYVGVVTLVRVFDGTLSKGQSIISVHTGRKYDVMEVGVMHPSQTPIEKLQAGHVGYVVCGMKKSSEAHIGDTFHLNGKPVDPLPGFEELKSMVYLVRAG
jgi:translation factor GUF1, mitochondrial